MIVRIEPGQRVDGGVSVGAGGPEKGFLVVRAVGDAAARHEAVGKAGPAANPHAVPEGRTEDRGAGQDLREADHAVRSLEAAGKLAGENPPPFVEEAAATRKGPSASERFERRAEKIARAAEIGVRAMMQDEAKLFPIPMSIPLPPLVEQRLPEVGDQSRLSRGDPGEQAGREDAHPGVEEGTWAVDAEGRDAIPFGLKRRVLIRIPILRDEKGRRPSGFAVPGEERGEVGLDRGVGVDDEEVAGRKKVGGVGERSGGAEDLRLPVENELWKIRRLLAQVALDLIAEMMEINRYFADAGLVQSPEMRDRQGDVEERQQRLREGLGRGPEANAPPGAKKDRAHGI
jgi:hypothetical protein